VDHSLPLPARGPDADLIVTHDPCVARCCDCIVEVVNGRILANRPVSAVERAAPGEGKISPRMAPEGAIARREAQAATSDALRASTETRPDVRGTGAADRSGRRRKPVQSCRRRRGVIRSTYAMRARM